MTEKNKQTPQVGDTPSSPLRSEIATPDAPHTDQSGVHRTTDPRGRSRRQSQTPFSTEKHFTTPRTQFSGSKSGNLRLKVVVMSVSEFREGNISDEVLAQEPHLN